jgi:hypothetical protein
MTTISDVFELKVQELTKKQLAHAEALSEMKNVEAEVQKLGHGKSWRRYLAQEGGKLTELLDVNLATIIAGAWNKQQDLLKYCDESKYRPNETIKLALIEHKIRSNHKPRIDFLVNGVKTGELKFDVKLTLTLEGLELSIKAGRIKALRIGSCKAAGEILLEGMRIAKQSSKKFELGDEISLGDGIAIG